MQKNEVARIYDQHAACAAALIRRFTRSDEDTKDLLQEWLIKVAGKVRSLDGVQNERAYLLRVAYRVAVDWSRKEKAIKRRDDRLASQDTTKFRAEPDPDRDLMRERLQAALQSLPPEQGVVMQLKLWDGLTFSEIADVLGISSNTASSRYRYGLSKLQEELQPLYDELCANTKS